MSDTTSQHRPVELDLHATECGLGECDHQPGQCPKVGRAIACEACTFDGVDLGMVDVIDPVPWACEHATGAVPGGRA